MNRDGYELISFFYQTTKNMNKTETEKPNVPVFEASVMSVGLVPPGLSVDESAAIKDQKNSKAHKKRF